MKTLNNEPSLANLNWGTSTELGSLRLSFELSHRLGANVQHIVKALKLSVNGGPEINIRPNDLTSCDPMNLKLGTNACLIDILPYAGPGDQIRFILVAGSRVFSAIGYDISLNSASFSESFALAESHTADAYPGISRMANLRVGSVSGCTAKGQRSGPTTVPLLLMGFILLWFNIRKRKTATNS